MSQHPTVKLRLGNETVHIDVKLAPLVRLLNDQKFLTVESCQEYWPGLAFIEFAFTGDAEEFLDVAQRNYRVELETFNEAADDERLSRRVRLLVVFPTADIPRLVKAFKKRQGIREEAEE
jgi:hypothetical protein